jgi:hypothetical protein
MFELNRTNQNDYQYGLYQEYLENIKKNSLLYSSNPELVIKYFRINLNLSNNIDQFDTLFPQNVPMDPANTEDIIGDLDGNNNTSNYTASEVSEIHGTGMFDKFENFTYDIFEFTPVIEMSPFQYTPNSDNNVGTTGSMSLMTIDRPNVGDLFVYYDKKNDQGESVTDQTEILQITSVQMQRTSNDILPIYQLEFKMANIKQEHLKKLSINEIYFYDNLQNNFTSSKCWSEYQRISGNDFTNELKEINKNYNKDNAYYEFNTLDCTLDSKPELKKQIPLVFNNLIKRLTESSYNQSRLKIVKNISTNLSIYEFLEGVEGSVEDLGKKTLLLKPIVFENTNVIAPIDLKNQVLEDNEIQPEEQEVLDNLTSKEKGLIQLKNLFINENNTFVIKNAMYLYLFYWYLYTEEEAENSLVFKKLKNYIIPEDFDKILNPLTREEEFQEIYNKYQTEEPIAFVDKNLRNNNFLIIDDLEFILSLPKYIIYLDPLEGTTGYYEDTILLNKTQTFINNNFKIYKLLFNYLRDIYKLCYCDKMFIKFQDKLDKDKEIFKNDSKISGTGYYNLFNCLINNDILSSLDNTSTYPDYNDILEGSFYWSSDGKIINYSRNIILPIGDLGLPIALSFQYGVQYRDTYDPTSSKITN